MATPKIPTHRICRLCKEVEGATGRCCTESKKAWSDDHEWISACQRCGQFVHERGCAEVAGTHVNPAAAMRADLVEIDAILTDADIPQEFAGQPLTLPERVRWLVQAVETNREAFRRQVKARKVERDESERWERTACHVARALDDQSAKNRELERNRLALGRKLFFIKRKVEFAGAVDAGRYFDRHYRASWDKHQWSEFLRTADGRAETRCPARCCSSDPHQCVRGLGHYGSHESGKCSWTFEED